MNTFPLQPFPELFFIDPHHILEIGREEENTDKTDFQNLTMGKTRPGTSTKLTLITQRQYTHHLLGFHWAPSVGTWNAPLYEERVEAILQLLRSQGYTLLFLEAISGPRVQIYMLDAPEYTREKMIALLQAHTEKCAITTLDQEAHLSYAPKQCLMLFLHTQPLL